MVSNSSDFPLYPIDERIKNSFVLVERIVFAIGVPLNIIGLYCIYCDKTTRIKWLLFNCQLWFFLCDIFFALLTTPVLLLPFIAFYSVGVLNYFSTSIQFGLLLTTLGGVAASVIHLFFHRHQTIVSTSYKLALGKATRIVVLSLNYVYFCGVTVPMYFFLEDDKTDALEHNRQDYPYFYPELFQDRTMMLSFENTVPIVIMIACYAFIWPAAIIFLVANTLNYLKSEHGTMSVATRSQIRRSLITIIIQISVALLFIVMPLIIFIYMVLFKSYLYVLCYFAIFLASLHASAGTLAGLLLNRQYRLTLIDLLRIGKKDRRQPKTRSQTKMDDRRKSHPVSNF